MGLNAHEAASRASVVPDSRIRSVCGCHICLLTSVPLLYFWNRMAMASGL